MGLLDLLNSEQGLLGMSLLAAAAPKERRTTIGEGLLQATQNVQAMRNAQEDRALKKRMMDMQLAGMEAQAQERKRLQEMEQRRGQYLGALDANQGPPMQPTAAGALAAGLSPQEYGMVAPQSADPMAGIDKVSPKDYTPESWTQFVRTRDPAVLRAAPKDSSPSPLATLIAERDRYPVGHPLRKVYDDQITKQSTHQPAVQNINYGTPMPAINPTTGKVELVRPDNKGGMAFTGIEPPPQNRDTKLPAELQRMQVAGDTMVKLMDDYETLLRRHNPRDPLTQMNSTVRADMTALKRNLELQFKELQALGALAGPDVEIIRQSLTDPFTMTGAYYGRDGLLKQVQRARDLVRIRAQAVMSSQGRPVDQASPSDNDPLGLRK